MYSSERKLVTFFKSFFDKTCLALIKQHMSILKEWLYFSSMISQNTIDFQRIEKYIKDLNPIQPNVSLSDTTKNFTLPSFGITDPLGATFKKNKTQTKDSRFNPIPGYSSAITIGQPIFNLRSYASNDISRSREQIVGNSRSSFKLTDQQVTKPLVSKLNCLYMTFVDNQHKIQFPKKDSDQRRFSDMHDMMYK